MCFVSGQNKSVQIFCFFFAHLCVTYFATGHSYTVQVKPLGALLLEKEPHEESKNINSKNIRERLQTKVNWEKNCFPSKHN